MESEVIYTLSRLKNIKTTGEDSIYAELNKVMNSRKLCQLFNAIYDSGIPAD